MSVSSTVLAQFWVPVFDLTEAANKHLLICVEERTLQEDIMVDVSFRWSCNGEG